MRRLFFAVIMFAIAIGIVACGRAETTTEKSKTEVISVDENVEL